MTLASGMPCRWLTIVYTTLLARTVTLPLVVKQQRGMAKLSVSPCSRLHSYEEDGSLQPTCLLISW